MSCPGPRRLSHAHPHCIGRMHFWSAQQRSLLPDFLRLDSRSGVAPRKKYTGRTRSMPPVRLTSHGRCSCFRCDDVVLPSCEALQMHTISQMQAMQR